MAYWTIRLSDVAEDQLSKLDKATSRRIIKYLRTTVLTAPHPRSVGKALSGQYGGYWRYRVGDHRIICEIRDNVLWVVVVMVGRRDKVYKRPIPEYNVPNEDIEATEEIPK